MRRMVPGVILAAFAAGYLCGAAMTTPAEAQLGDIMKGAGKSGALGPVGELGSTIIDMQKNVDELNKNLGVLKKVKAALGG
jgi:hypothetical protein